MAKPKLNPAATRLVQAAADAARGAGRRTLQARHGLPERLSRAISAAGLGREEFQQLLSVELRSAAREVLASFMRDLRAGRVNPATKGIMMGICLDKEQALEARATIKSMSVAVLINDRGTQSREDIIARLTGETFDMPGTATSSSVFLPTPVGAPKPIPPVNPHP